MPPPPCLLIVSPHADDEVVGAPGLVVAAREAGWRVVNLLCFLRTSERRRRLVEVTRATERLGVELSVASEPLLSLSAGHEPDRVPELLTAEIGALAAQLSPQILLSPGPHDMHYAHEAVAAGARGALEASDGEARWAVWGWWGELGPPTTVAGYDSRTMDQAQRALAEHAGELERLDLSTALEARARWNATVGPERVMGPGYREHQRQTWPFADLLLETRRHGPVWSMAQPRVLEADQALTEPAWTGRDLTPWLDSPSASRLVAQAPSPD